MSFLSPWILFFLIPLALYYKKTKQEKLLIFSLFFIIIALSRPVLTHVPTHEKFDAQDYIVAIDVSYSMQGDDLKPSRYVVAKQAIKTLLQNSLHDRFTLFAFTSNAMLISPPTTDSRLSINALDILNPDYILTKATSLKSLLTTVSKTSFETKHLIIFTDGGEEHKLQKLVTLAKHNRIIPYVVAVGTSEGATLQKDGKILKDEHNNLVISRINPMLKDFAYQSGGKYYTLESSDADVVSQILSDLSANDKNLENSEVEVLSYIELFWIALLGAIILFFIRVTKFHTYFALASLLLFVDTPKLQAQIFDFYHFDKAQIFYEQGEFILASQELLKVSPSVSSYYNLGVIYYKNKQYKKALQYFSKIKTSNPTLKQNIYYNMGNCAFKLEKYSRAKIYYKKALSLGFDQESYENLMLIYKYNLQDKKDLTSLLPRQNTKQNTQESKQKKAKKKSDTNSTQTSSNANYKIGYKAYELINKGYTDETHPW
ncbi:vWA domain-containing protein [Sulfurimonas sp.]|uniref:vWA domain-containing protein n=1 Tax=Sulfurimonas sp. TaxID=2022749 RepID=UPI003D11FB9C